MYIKQYKCIYIVMQGGIIALMAVAIPPHDGENNDNVMMMRYEMIMK